MADRYSATGSGNLAPSPGRTVLSIDNEASPVVRGKVYDLVIGVEGTPADNVAQWIAQRMTGGGTSSSVVPAPLDFDAPAANLESGENYSTEPVLTSATELLDMPLNTRASFRWVASPGGEWSVPAVAQDGIAIIAIHGSATDAARATAHFEE